MLSTKEQEEIGVELARYPNKRAVCIEALRIVQDHRGWVSDEALREVAGLLDLSPTELDEVATFYNLIFREPVGRHVILVCNSVSCWVMGSESLFEHLTVRLGVGLGETTEDGRFTLLPITCLGACDRAPAMMIDNDFHGDLDPAKIDKILEEYE